MGNHDTHYRTVSTYYRRQFGLYRKNGCPGLEGTVYSFDYGPVHVVVLSENDPIHEQTAWLEEDLKRNTKPWTIVNIHVPPFTSKAERIDNNLKGTVVPLFTKYGVDLIVSGHDKSYMRTFPMRDEQPLPPEAKGAPIYVIVVSGEQFYPIADLPWIHVAHKDETMYSFVDVDERTLSYTATTIEGRVIDRFTLTK